MSFSAEIGAARARMAAGELETALAHLERAHVIGQRQVWPHVLSHWLMLRVELRRGRMAAVFGQCLRIVLGALGSALGVVPTGNTGGSDIGMFKRLPVPAELQAAIDAQPRNQFAEAARLAWVIVAMMAVTMWWPDSQQLFGGKRHPVVVGWPLLLATMALAMLLSSQRLIPGQRAKACKLLSVGLLLVGGFYVSAALAVCLGMLAGTVFMDAEAK